MDFILMALGLLPAKELAESMQESRTLTIMAVVGLILFTSLALFLFYMAEPSL